jgi:hypothetical protein
MPTAVTCTARDSTNTNAVAKASFCVPFLNWFAPIQTPVKGKSGKPKETHTYRDEGEHKTDGVANGAGQHEATNDVKSGSRVATER